MIARSPQSVPQVDLTAVNAVQSLFDDSSHDPWAHELAADFVDFVLWNESIRYPVLLLADAVDRAESLVAPAILDDLGRREPGLVCADIRILSDRPMLDHELLAPAWKAFEVFVTNNSSRVRGFLSLHSSSWIKEQIRSRLPDGSGYIFDVVDLAARPETAKLAHRLNITVREVYYLFDLVLKYLLYAEQAQGQYYLSHPIRARLDFQQLSTAVTVTTGPAREVPFRLGPYLVAAAGSRNRDWFTSRLHEARALVRETGMIELRQRGSVGKEELRQLAVRLGLPAGVKHFQAVDNTAAVASAAAGLAGGYMTNSFLPTVVGSALSVVTKLWTGNVPVSVSQATWLQWMFEWPIEREARGGG